MTRSSMLREALEAPAVIARQMRDSAEAYRAFGAALQRSPPGSVLTVARGSSDHAAHFMAYLVMARMGRLVTSLPMSLITLHQSKIDCNGLLALAFSQSGQSPDLVAPLQYFTRGGAITAAFVNETDSPLARAADWFFPLCAGSETSVAATKSFIAQLAAGVQTTAAWQGDQSLERALASLPQAMQDAAHADWSPAIDVLVDAERMFVIGRGTGLAVAMEAALKFKETCAIQAEGFSGAEVQHGPMALVSEGFPMLVFAPRGPAQAGLIALAAQMRSRGARVLLAAPRGTPGAELPLVEAPHEDLDPLTAILSFYVMVEALARARGHDPDHPPHLSKITRTR